MDGVGGKPSFSSVSAVSDGNQTEPGGERELLIKLGILGPEGSSAVSPGAEVRTEAVAVATTPTVSVVPAVAKNQHDVESGLGNLHELPPEVLAAAGIARMVPVMVPTANEKAAGGVAPGKTEAETVPDFSAQQAAFDARLQAFLAQVSTEMVSPDRVAAEDSAGNLEVSGEVGAVSAVSETNAETNTEADKRSAEAAYVEQLMTLKQEYIDLQLAIHQQEWEAVEREYLSQMPELEAFLPQVAAYITEQLDSSPAYAAVTRNKKGKMEKVYEALETLGVFRLLQQQNTPARIGTPAETGTPLPKTPDAQSVQTKITSRPASENNPVYTMTDIQHMHHSDPRFESVFNAMRAGRIIDDR